VVNVRSLVLSISRPFSARARARVACSGWKKIRGCAGGSAELVSIVADEAFCDLDGPPPRITNAALGAAILEDIALPSVDRIAGRVQRSLNT